MKKKLIVAFIFAFMLTGTAVASYNDTAGHWADADISELSQKGIVKGYPGGDFRPENTVSIEEFVKLVVESAELPVEKGDTSDWSRPYINSAMASGIVKSGDFSAVNMPITRAQAARIFSRALKYDREPKDQGFSDRSTYSSDVWAVNKVSSYGVMAGYPDNTFRGDKMMTRAETVATIVRFMQPERRKYPVAPIRVPVLMYHHFLPATDGNNSAIVSPDKLEADIAYLVSQGYDFIHLDELRRYLRGELRDIPDKPIIITVDDGYKSNYDYLFPIAKKYGVKHDIASIVWGIGSEDERIIPKLSWAEMREMQNSGLSKFHNHTYDLHSTGGVSYTTGAAVGEGVLPMEGESADSYITRVVADLDKADSMMNREIGSSDRFMMYPFGIHSDLTESVMRNRYSGTLTTKPGIRTYERPSDLWKMPRINVSQSTNLSTALEKY